MKTEYAQALITVINEGTSVNDALTGLKQALDRKHHSKLYAPVLLEVIRTLESSAGATTAIVTIAKTSDAHTLQVAILKALEQLGTLKDTQITGVVDETLIGGFVATYNYKEYDHSYKNALKSLYESIIK